MHDEGWLWYVGKDKSLADSINLQILFCLCRIKVASHTMPAGILQLYNNINNINYVDFILSIANKEVLCVT